MRKFLISAALLASTVAAGSPAAAQWAPPPQAPYGNAYGYQNNYGQVRRLEVRLQQIRREIERLDRRNILSEREANRLNSEARSLQYRIRQMGYNGLSGRERYEVEQRIARLEYRIQREATDGNRYRGADRGRDGWSDNDRDGRNDRYEDDRGRYPG